MLDRFWKRVASLLRTAHSDARIVRHGAGCHVASRRRSQAANHIELLESRTLLSAAPLASDNQLKPSADLGNEPSDTVSGVSTVPAAAAFSVSYDFGTTASPLQPGYDRVTSSTTYNAAVGFGWQAPVFGLDRFVGTDLSRDLNYAPAGAFLVDLPNGIYEVEITVGDTGPFAHDQSIQLEGATVDTLTTAPSEIVTRTYTVNVHDAQLSVFLDGRGGVDPNMVISALRVVATGPVLTVSVDRDAIGENGGEATGTVTRQGDLESELIVQLSSSDETEVVVPASVTIAAGASSASFAISSADDSELDGTQTVTISASAEGAIRANVTVNVLDDESSPTPPDSAHKRFDFGTSSSPVESNFTRVTALDAYSTADGHGWLNNVFALDRRTGTDVSRDLVFGPQGEFAVDLPNDTYQVTLTMGDEGPFRHDQTIFIEGQTLDTVSMSPFEVVTRTYTTTITDGQLNLVVDGRGGADPNMVLNALEIIPVAPVLDITIDADSVSENGGTATSTITRTGNTSSELVVSLSSSDETELAVPQSVTIAAGESSAGFAISGVDDDELDGTQSVTISGSAAGAVSAETTINVLDDEVAPPPPPPEPVNVRFDFGTSSSPVESNFTRVTARDGYSSADGYGWLNAVFALDRTTGTDVSRDLVFGPQGVFAVDLPNDTYQVRLTMGDEGPYRHDQTISIEGQTLDTVSMSPFEVVTRTYTTTITDGQLNLVVDGRGGADPNMVLNALEIIPVAPILGLTIDADSVSENGGTATGTITRTGNTSSELVVSLSSSDETELAVPQSVTIAAGESSAGFAISGVDDDELDGTQSVTISASAAGAVSAETTINVLDDEVAPPPPLEPFSGQFDFGTELSLIASGSTQVTNTTVYNSSLGYGWQSAVSGIDRGVGAALTRDLNYGPAGTFLVDVANGTYQVELTVGDAGLFSHDQSVTLEGQQLETIITASGETLTRTYLATVTDGQLTLFLDGRGGVDPNMAINGLRITPAQGAMPISVSFNSQTLGDGSTVDFGTARTGTPLSQTFVVSNISTETQSLNTTINVPNGYSVAAGFADTQLSPGESTTFRVQLDAAAIGTYSGTVGIGLSGSAAQSLEFQVTGEVIAATAAYEIEVRFVGSGLSDSQRAIFTTAAARWSEIIVGDLRDAYVPGFGLVDDLVIEASAPSIDGAGGILGQAGPTYIRRNSYLPISGIMQFDSADLAMMERNGVLLDVILHEMGHVMGIGTIWGSSLLNLVSGAGSSDPRFTGQAATDAYNTVFGRSESSVPLANTGGSGTRDSHWRESVFRNELMTGYVNFGTNPLSTITIGALADMGYSVNSNAADVYTPPGVTSVQVVTGAVNEIHLDHLDHESAHATDEHLDLPHASGQWHIGLDADFETLPLTAQHALDRTRPIAGRLESLSVSSAGLASDLDDDSLRATSEDSSQLGHAAEVWAETSSVEPSRGSEWSNQLGEFPSLFEEAMLADIWAKRSLASPAMASRH